jgi:hypothetical protein
MSSFFASEGLKIALLAVSFGGLYVLSRWASRWNESNPRVNVAPKPESPVRMEAPQGRSKIVAIDRRPRFHSSQAVDEAELLPIRILQMYFVEFDFEPGPPDVKSFAGELHVKLYNADHGYDWTMSYFVATPEGLERMLETENWDYAYADSAFFVRRYDTKIIRQAVVEQLLSTVEKPGPPREPEDRYV